MPDHRIICASEDETAAYAGACAEKAVNGDIITLQGPMGAGKTAFARGFIQHLMGYECDVPSPTFTLVQTYDTPKGLLWHFDFYRLEKAEDIYETGWEEALSDGILLIEWPERLGNLLPIKRQDIIIDIENPLTRSITHAWHDKEASQ